jgi:hypothetical protein
MRSAYGWAVTAVRAMQQWQLLVCLPRLGGSGSSNPTAVTRVHTHSSAMKLGGCAVSLVAASGRRRSCDCCCHPSTLLVGAPKASSAPAAVLAAGDIAKACWSMSCTEFTTAGCT